MIFLGFCKRVDKRQGMRGCISGEGIFGIPHKRNHSLISFKIHNCYIKFARFISTLFSVQIKCKDNSK